MSGLTLITPTGGRPEAFALLEGFMSRQTHTGDVQWLVVDDCQEPTPCTMGQTVIRPQPFWKPGQVTCARNLSAAIPCIKHDKVLLLEDDDAYMPTYLSVMSSRLDSHLLVGECFSHYYHVSRRRYKIWNNKVHSSLAQIGFRSEILPIFTSLCQTPRGSIDIFLCQRVHPSKKFFYPWSGIYVGMKGMPGRPGVVNGHRITDGDGWKSDPDLQTLRSWIGDDANLYAQFYREVEA